MRLPDAYSPVDVVLDSVGTTWDESMKALRKGGRLVVFGGTGGPEVTVDVRALYLNWKSIRGTTMEVVLDCEYLGRGTDPWGKTRAGFSFRTEINRQDWGLKWNQAIETGGVLVANKVRIEGEGQFVRDGE